MFEKWALIYFITLLFVYQKVDVWLHFPDFKYLIVDCVYAFVGLHFSELSFGVIPEAEVLKLHCLLRFIGMEPKLGVTVADIRSIIPFELMLPFNDWFGIVFLHIINVVVKELAIIVFVPLPANQFGLFKVLYVSYCYLCVHCGAPLFVSLQVNEPYFIILTVP